MAEIGTVWAIGSWASDTWAAGSWADLAATDPHIVLTPAVLTFGALESGSNPASQDCAISNGGGGSLTPSLGAISYDQGSGWLDLQLVGTTVTATCDITGLAIGSYQATAPITDAGADNSPQTVTVQLSILSPDGGTSHGPGDPPQGSSLSSMMWGGFR